MMDRRKFRRKHKPSPPAQPAPDRAPASEPGPVENDRRREAEEAELPETGKAGRGLRDDQTGRGEAEEIDAPGAPEEPYGGSAGPKKPGAARHQDTTPLFLADPVNAGVASEPAGPDPARAPAAPVHAPPALPDANDKWAALATVSVNAEHLSANRIVTAVREDPAHTAFDVLRTRLLQALVDNGWKRVAITSPTKDCGKTFTAANLAISMSRQENCRTILLDCDMRRPSLHRVMGVQRPGSMGDMLRGMRAPEDHLLRLGTNDFHAGHNIAFGFNSVIEPYASELLQDPRAAETLDRVEKTYAPDAVLFDLPPALYYDDVIAFRPHFDGVLLVVGGGVTTQKEIKEVERRLGESTPLLGMVLNKAESTELNRYRY
jgi:Mrp family chromosome partitioning ATPase